MNDKDPYLVPGLVRGLAVLKTFSPQAAENSLADIARSLGITRSAVFRTVHTLVSEGYLLEVPGTAHFRLGPKVLSLSYGFLASREVLEVAQKPLEALRDTLDWSTHLGVLDGRHVLYLIRYPSTDGLSSLVHVGSRLPASQTAMGRLLLSHKTERDIRRLMADRPEREVAMALANAAKDRQVQVVNHDGQFESGLCSVAAPIQDISGAVIAAISATKSGAALDTVIERQTLKTAYAISKGLGA